MVIIKRGENKVKLRGQLTRRVRIRFRHVMAIFRSINGWHMMNPPENKEKDEAIGECRDSSPPTATDRPARKVC